MDGTTVGSTTYFHQPGRSNTSAVLQLAKKRADELGIKTVIVATSTGSTGMAAAELFKGLNVVVVSHSTGFQSPNQQELTPENRAKIEALGAHVLTCQHAMGGVGRAVRRKLNTYQIDEIMAYTLRIFGQGMKVACEIALMAADAGLVRAGEPALSIGGSGGGADTCVLLSPVNAQDFFEMKVMEIVCKPGFYAEAGLNPPA